MATRSTQFVISDTPEASESGSEQRLEVIDFTGELEAPSISLTDQSGSVGSVTVTTSGSSPEILAETSDKYYKLLPSDTVGLWGRITGGSQSDEANTTTFTGLAHLHALLAYNVTAEPYQGTIQGAFDYYGALATSALVFHVYPPDIPVVFPGWTGELWVVIKELCATFGVTPTLGYGGQVAIVGGEYTTLTEPGEHFALTVNRQYNSDTLAQKVEVTRYNPAWVTNQLVYPPGGWTPEVNVLSVGPQETQEYTLELDTSITSFTQPTMVTYVSSTHDSSSRYTIVGDDGFPIQPAQWTDYGGKLLIERGSDTRSLVVTLKGPDKDIIMSNGRPCSTYSVALASDTSGSRYSTLRIVGTGVRLTPETVAFNTGVSASQTGTEVGASVDGRFIQNDEQFYRAGSLAASRFAGGLLTGSMSIPAGRVYGVEDSEYFATPGVSMPISGRRWRVTSKSFSPNGTSYSLEDSLLYGEMQTAQEGKTYAVIQTANTGKSYTAVRLKGTY